MIFRPSQALARVAVMLPFVLLTGSAAGLLLVAPFAWGAANEFRYPASLPVIGGVIFAVPSLLLGLTGLVAVGRKTARIYRIAIRRALIGLLFIAMMIGLLVSYVLSIGDAASYRGAFDPVRWRWDPWFHPQAFIALTVFISVGVPMGVFGAAAWLLYCGAFSPDGLAEPEGPDPMGEIARTGGAFPTR